MDIINTSFQKTLGDKYLSYALSTIMSRSLPDVRDGLKPVHRRLLFAMRELKLNPQAGFKKCARVVGDVIGKFHPHGDVAVYDAMVRLAQDFSLRYPLVEGQGNFGNIDGDNAAAMRYTEARLTDIAMMLFEGIDEDAIDFKQTYDGEANEPSVFPAAFPNLLANGASGIAVGMATNIPPHNIIEICDALLACLKKPSIATEDLLEYIKGPDFPTGGELLIDAAMLKTMYTTGKGTFKLRAAYTIERLDRGKYNIIVNEIPYGVPKSRLLEKIGQVLDAKRIPLLSDVRDESSETLRIVVEPKSSQTDPAVLMEFLYKETELETRFSANLNVLGTNLHPTVMNLKDTLSSYLNHRYAVLQRRTTFRLNKIEARLNLLAGFLIVFLNIDEVIQIIRNEDEPKQELMKRFNLNDIQAEAILNMRLRALRKLEEMELKREYDELEAEKQSKQALLNDPNLQTTHLVNEVKALKKYFLKDPRGERKSAIIENSIELNLNINDFIEKEPITIVCSKKGWIKSVKGHIADNSEHKYKEGDSEGYVLHAHTTDKLIAFTSVGKSYTLTCDKLPGGRGFGDPLRLMVEMAPSEELIYLFVAPQTSEHFLVASSEGRGFKVDSMQLISQTRNGKHILNIAEGAKATHCIPCNSTHIAIIGENRKLAIFTTAEIPTMNRGRGVILQKYLQGGISDIQCFNDTDGLKWKYGSGVKTETALDRWKVKRGQAGRLAPNGFPRSNKFK